MRQFDYQIKDKSGLHARPAGILVKSARAFASAVTITLTRDDKTADAKNLFAVMGLAAKSGDVLRIICEGDDEDAAAQAMTAFCAANFSGDGQ
ncbi:MAG: HPr family phosphocarrier protein [Peptococcaceae bacterium]|jgi:phosphocarrier protein|nr:HPr family phosphocarrier protein [Peptococcaceae bacterium]